MEIIFPRDFEVSGLEKYLDSQVSDLNKDNVLFLFKYKDNNLKQAIWEMKFKSNRRVAEVFGKFLANKINKLLNAGDKYLLLPTPIHKKRRDERGFNQCEWLCEEIIKNIRPNRLSKIKYEPKILLREKYTTKQSWSDKKAREENLKGAFKVSEKNKDEIVGIKIILIDDVLTTGSTIREMRQTLKESGASEIISIVIAH